MAEVLADIDNRSNIAVRVLDNFLNIMGSVNGEIIDIGSKNDIRTRGTTKPEFNNDFRMLFSWQIKTI